MYLTNPIFYPNGQPHIGHLYTATIADTFKRLNKLFDKNVFFTIGVDEHGQKVATAAAAKGLSAIDYTNELSLDFIDFFKSYDINFDFWIRTTSENHKNTAKFLWNKMKENGWIYKSKYSGYYSVADEAYVDNSGPNTEWREEECYYFKLSAFEEKLKTFYKNNKNFIYPAIRFNEAEGFLNQGLKDFAISRPKSRLSWGIEIPEDPEHVMYVWVDALCNYLTCCDYPNANYKNLWPATHIIGKDILKFHAIYWPAMLMAAEIDLPKKIIAHGWLLNKDTKISKSLNNMMNLEELKEQYTSDGLRFFLLKSVNIGNDCEVRKDIIHHFAFSTLSNKFYNFFMRIMGLNPNKIEIKQTAIDIISSTQIDLQLQIFKNSAEQASKGIEFMDAYLEEFVKTCDMLNEYFQENQLWKLEEKNKFSQLFYLLNIFKNLTILISPVIPNIAKEILSFFKAENTLQEIEKNSTFDYEKKITLIFKKETQNQKTLF